jgi:hypothetical protein
VFPVRLFVEFEKPLHLRFDVLVRSALKQRTVLAEYMIRLDSPGAVVQRNPQELTKIVSRLVGTLRVADGVV